MRLSHLRLLVLAVALVMNLSAAYYLDTGEGQLTTQKVTIPSGESMLTGVIYIPTDALQYQRRPAVALAHGITGAKEYMSGIALEVARNGFIALTVDLNGHGGSGGSLRSDDPSIGLLSALKWLESQPYVDPNRIAVGGHSLGAGASRGAAYLYGKNVATIMIGGGLGSMSEGVGYGSLNTTFPSNMLFVVGEQDVLFDIGTLGSNLKSAFNTESDVVPGQVYGDFGWKTARKLVLLKNIHSFEPLDPTTTYEVVYWLHNSFNPYVKYLFQARPQIYLGRDFVMLASVAIFIGLISPLSEVLNSFIPGSHGTGTIVRNRFLRERTVLLGWSLLGLVVFLPAMLFGLTIPFPPLLFGSSQAWWLLTTGLLGFVIILLLSKRAKSSINPLSEVIASFKPRDMILAVILFVLLYVGGYAVEYTTLLKLKIIVPVFAPLSSLRLPIFPLFLPFYFVYFVSEGMWLHLYRQRQSSGLHIFNALRTITLKVAPYIALIVIQYIPMFLLNRSILPGFTGFFIEFLWGILPIFIISTFISWWLYRYTGRIWMGAILNTLIFSWVSAGLFPFGTFR